MEEEFVVGAAACAEDDGFLGRGELEEAGEVGEDGLGEVLVVGSELVVD